MEALLNLNIIDGPVVGVVYTLGLGALLFLLARRPSVRWLITAVAALLVGSIGALLTLWISSATDAFGVALSATTSVWVYITFAAVCLAIATLWKSTVLRTVLAALSIVIFIAVGTVAINADFGLDRTVADLAGVSTTAVVKLPPVAPPTAAALPGGPLFTSWKPPASMPLTGSVSSVVIPNTVSGFTSRPAGLYLPPAALVKDPPALPLVIMMMGQPGNPDPSFQQQVLDGFAARHSGLAPIVLVVDQLGNISTDPLCIDSTRFGKANTFLATDAVAFARAHLHILQDAAHWTIAGYSNGGECALSLGAAHPEIWGNVLDISGEEYAGSDAHAKTLASMFAGNAAAYEATKPLGILASHHYSDTVGIFTVGSNDRIYRTQAIAVAAAAKAAGWETTYFEVPNGGHVVKALMGGLAEGYTVLFPRLGLSAPGAAV